MCPTVRICPTLPYNVWEKVLLPSKHKIFVWHLYNVGPTSSTLVQHCIKSYKCFVFTVRQFPHTGSNTVSLFASQRPSKCKGSEFLTHRCRSSRAGSGISEHLSLCTWFLVSPFVYQLPTWHHLMNETMIDDVINHVHDHPFFNLKRK